MALVAGCANSPGNLQAPVPGWQFSTIDETLWAQTTSGDRHKLPVQGQQFHPLPSPDGKWLAVEIQRMSNLRTLSLFRYTADGFSETAINASTHLWRLAREIDAIDTDNIRYPAIRVVNWHPSSHFLNVELRGETDDGQYRKTHELPIADLLN